MDPEGGKLTCAPFASPNDQAHAALAMPRYLPALLRAFEDGLRGLGLEIVSRSHFLDAEGRATPVLEVRGQRLRFHLELRNAMEDFLTRDREARPLRVDPRLTDDAYARRKLAEVVSGRIEILRALEESQDEVEAKARVEDLAGRFAWLRVDFGEGRG